MNDWVLIGYNYQDKKTGKIMKVYKDASELRYLVDNAEEADVPKKMYNELYEEFGLEHATFKRIPLEDNSTI